MQTDETAGAEYDKLCDFENLYRAYYMDDLVMVHEDKTYLQECRKELERVAWEERRLTFNEKTQVFPISEGVDYVGWHFFLTNTGKVIRRLRTSNKRRFKRRLKAFRKQYGAGKKTFDEITQSLASYNGHLKHGHTWKLRKNTYGKFVLTKGEEEKNA